MIFEKIKELFMTLVNSDKSSGDRAQPSIGAIDVQSNPMAHATASLSPRATGTQQGARVVTKDDTITVYDANNARILIGRLPDGTYGFIVSNIGYDVTSLFS